MTEEALNKLDTYLHDWVAPGQFAYSFIVDQYNVHCNGKKCRDIDRSINDIAKMVGNSIITPVSCDGSWLLDRHYSNVQDICKLKNDDIGLDLELVKYMILVKKAVSQYYAHEDKPIVVITYNSEYGYALWQEFANEQEVLDAIDC